MQSFWDFEQLLPNFTGWDDCDEPEFDQLINNEQIHAAANGSVPE